MATPVANSYTKAAPTFFKGTRGTSASTFTTNSNPAYVDVSNISSITSVPNGARVLFATRGSKSTAGNGDIALSDGTTIFLNLNWLSSEGNISKDNLLATETQDSGGPATVKVQARSSDANNMNVSTPKSTFFVCTDGDAPEIVRGPLGISSIILPWKISGEKVFAYYGNNVETAGVDTVTFNGILSVAQDPVSGDVKDTELTASLITEQVQENLQFLFSVEPILGDILIWDWSGHGVNWS